MMSTTPATAPDLQAYKILIDSQANTTRSQDLKDTKVKASEIHDMMTGRQSILDLIGNQAKCVYQCRQSTE